jgi:hypothetical protein
VLLGCGYGGQFLADVHWSRWTATSAAGTAVWWQNLCTPNCAAGKFRRTGVKVRLSRPRVCTRPRTRLFTRMTLKGAGRQAAVVNIPYAGLTRCP